MVAAERGLDGIVSVAEREVVEEVSGWLRILDDLSVDRTWTGPPEVQYLLDPVNPQNKPDHDGVSIRDVVIDLAASVTKVRIYKPDDAPESAKLPVLLHFHGGGFCVGSPDQYFYYAFYSRLVREARVVCVSVWLRLAPENRLPRAVDDAHAGLLWLRSVARAEVSEPWLDSHADFERVFLIGDSSGANLVHAVAARAGEEDLTPLRLRGGIPMNPGFVRATRSKSELTLQSDSPFLTLDMIDKFLELALPIGSTKDHPITCPMGAQAPALNTLRLPDLLVPIAENDLIRDTGLEYVEAVKQAGHNAELLLSHGVGHCFYLNQIGVSTDPQIAKETERLIEAISKFVNERF